MKTLKKIMISTLCAGCAIFGGVAVAGLKEVQTASAETQTEYTVVETSMMMKLEDVYVDGGNFNIYVTLPQYDTTVTQDNVRPTADLATVFDSFGFFDSVKIGEKSLRELGCSGFYDNQIGFGIGEPKNIVKLYLHADPETWSAAYANGEIKFGDSQPPITMEKGTTIPGYNYLMSGENAVVYRTNMAYVTERITDLTYSYLTAGQTEIDSLRYVQGHDGTCGYLGISFEGDDYAADGTQMEFVPNYQHAFNGKLIPNSFAKKILVNGEAGKVDYYSLLNLGEAGKGYFSFVIRVHEDEVESITVPQGSYFPAYVMKSLQQINYGNFVYMGYATTQDMTFYKNADGEFVAFEGYAEDKTAQLQALRAEKTEADYFADDLSVMDDVVATAVTAMSEATTIAEVDVAFATAKSAIDGVVSKADTISAAKADLTAYKAGLFREAEETQRLSLIAEYGAAIDGAESKTAVETAVMLAKAEIDTLKTAAQYADEELAVDKANAIDQISNYHAEDAYLAEEAAERTTAVENGLAAVAAATNVEEIAQAVTDVKAAIDTLKTKADIVFEAWQEVSTYKAELIYRDAQASERQGAIAAAKTALDNANCKADVEAAVEKAKAAIDALKTDAELTEEEKNAANAVLAEEKATALAKINEYKASVNYADYTAENQAKINDLYRAAKKAVDDALTKDAITAAVTMFETELANVPKIDAQIPDSGNTDVDAEEQKNPLSSLLGGCQSSASLAGVMMAVALGAVLFHKKKEN